VGFFIADPIFCFLSSLFLAAQAPGLMVPGKAGSGFGRQPSLSAETSASPRFWQAQAELFGPEEPLRFVLAADFDQLKKDRDEESEERPGQVRIMGQDGAEVEIPIQVRTRGNFRLQRRNCSDPPLRLNFPETSPQGTVFDGQDKLKLVTHCRDSDRYEQNLLEEYLAYRIYNQLTDKSFRVRLAEITYMDTSGKNDPVERMGFLIEDAEALATRLGGRMVEAPTTRPENFVPDQLSLMYLFQYMVGNVDWGTGYSHNVQILLLDRGYYPIAYDFDWTGLVDAPYAGPNELTQDQHTSVRQRVYWGHCLPGIDYPGLFASFMEKREAILDLARNQIGLSEGNVKSAVRYLEEFFDIIGNPRRAEREIINSCRST
jgi:hypothetical protein